MSVCSFLYVSIVYQKWWIKMKMSLIKTIIIINIHKYIHKCIINVDDLFGKQRIEEVVGQIYSLKTFLSTFRMVLLLYFLYRKTCTNIYLFVYFTLNVYRIIFVTRIILYVWISYTLLLYYMVYYYVNDIPCNTIAVYNLFIHIIYCCHILYFIQYTMYFIWRAIAWNYSRPIIYCRRIL